MTKVAVFPIDAIGHLKSVVCAVATLADDKRFAAITGFGRAFAGTAFSKAGLGFQATAAEPIASDPDGDLRWKSFVRPRRDMGRTLDAVLRFAPDVILYDPFSLYGWMAAAVTGVPSAAFVTMNGYGVLTDGFVLANGWDREDVQAENAAYRATYGADAAREHCLPVLFPSRDMTLVHTVARLHNPLQASDHPLLHKVLRTSAPEQPIGRSADWTGLIPRSEGDVDPDADSSLLARLAAAKAQGKRIVLFSLGTVITDFRYETPVGGAPSGAAFLRRMLDYAFAAARGNPDMLLVASVGRRYLADPDPLAPPPNAIVRETVPQAQILRQYADAFITHHGANSEAEAILAGVGMIALPGAGDQIPNARAAIAAGAALALWDIKDPFGSCTPSALDEAVTRVTREPRFGMACKALAREADATGARPSLGDHLIALSQATSRVSAEAPI